MMNTYVMRIHNGMMMFILLMRAGFDVGYDVYDGDAFWPFY